jgi:predicted lipoprotein with Yx(FWY)xxD motif
MEHDHTQSLEIAAHLKSATQKIHDIANDVGAAKTVVKFTTTDRDKILAKYMKPYLYRGDSAAKAECYARCEEGFERELSALRKQDSEAEQLIARNNALEKVYDANRSLLSFSKTIREDLQG